MDNNRKDYQKKYREEYKTRAKRVNLTFSNEEYRAISRAANGQNKKVTPYLKDLALNGLNHQATIPKELEEELRTLRYAIRTIANNVNQIAHYSNTIRGLVMQDEHNLLQHLRQLDDAVMRYTEGRILERDDDH